VVASDKRFYWLFQEHPERIQPFVASLLPRMQGYVFSAPVLKEREYRLDGLFLPPPDQPECPALILEAQMAAEPSVLLRLHTESARRLQQRQRQQLPIRHWRTLVIFPSRKLNFGDPLPVWEFLEGCSASIAVRIRFTAAICAWSPSPSLRLTPPSAPLRRSPPTCDQQ